MAALDTALTGNSHEKVTGQYHHYPQTVEKWVFGASGDRAWYLSDAGYSRVDFSENSGRLFLTSNSTARVKARWDAAAPQRQHVEEMVRGWMTANGWSHPFEDGVAEALTFKKLCGTMAAVNCTKAGQKTGDIAKSAGVSAKTVGRWVNKAGFKKRGGKLRHVSERAEQVVDRLLEWGGMFTEWTGYWMDSKGKMHPVDAHVSWAKLHVLSKYPDLTKDLGESGVYMAMSKLGWLKIVVERKQVFIDPTRASRLQKAAVQEYAIENRLKVVDALTQRVIFDPRDDSGGMED